MFKMSNVISIDGSRGEGGGQILRTSLALSLITGKPFHLRNIRSRRPKPGLQAQHLMCVNAAAKIGKARLRGASLGSCDLVFEPGTVKTGEFEFKIGTAGATSLVAHAIYLPLALANGDSTVRIEGGTHVKASPCFDFLARTWSKYLALLGIAIDLRMERAGFYPRGGGAIQAAISSIPTRGTNGIRPFQGLVAQVPRRGVIVCGTAGLPTHVADRMTKTAAERLASLGLDIDTVHETWIGGPGCMLGIELATSPVPTFLFSLGEKGKPAEAVAHDAVDLVETFLAADPIGVDEHSADQLLLPLAFANGPSQFRVSAIPSHLLTNAAVIARFLDRPIHCEGTEGAPGDVRIE
ncbi:MAG: RNA 3'-phosphate cyclase [Planctomycetes bacterium]|nr:RNA 3'-phosphate cyclase [Planctomycetota bacterium]